MKRPAKKRSSKSFDQVLRERAVALADRVREDDRRLAAPPDGVNKESGNAYSVQSRTIPTNRHQRRKTRS